jgi:hypothetical protein
MMSVGEKNGTKGCGLVCKKGSFVEEPVFEGNVLLMQSWVSLNCRNSIHATPVGVSTFTPATHPMTS